MTDGVKQQPWGVGDTVLVHVTIFEGCQKIQDR